MLLDESSAALSELIEMLHESLDDYEESLQKLHQKSLADSLNNAMNQRSALTLMLEEHARAQLHLRPRAADTEREDFHHLWSRLKGLIMDQQVLMLEERLQQERQLLTRLSLCESYRYPAPLDDLLQQLHHNIMQQIKQLNNLLAG